MENAWDSLLSVLISKYRLDSCLSNHFSNEVDIIRRLSKVRECSDTFRTWLQGLPDVRAAGEEKSNLLRERGNEILKSKTNNNLAMEAYSKAIFAAPGRSQALAFGHANRAFLLIGIGRYREALDDCQQAIAAGYPQHKRLKVYFRQAECAERLNDAKLLGTVVESITSFSAKKQLSKAEEDKIADLIALQKHLADHLLDNQKAQDEEKTASPKLVERQGPHVGRYMVTTKLIEENSLIIKETAVSFVPVYDSDTKSTIPSFDCQKCARVNVVPFPCAVCGRACYCSSQCRNDHAELHFYECYGYRKHLWYQIGIAHLGIRSFLDGYKQAFSNISKSTDAFSIFQTLTEASANDNNELGDYGRVFRLVTNFERMDINDVLQYALAALMLTVYLRDCTKFFDELITTSKTAMSHSELFILSGSLIFRHIGQLVCNGHAISELRATLPSIVDCIDNRSFEIKPGLLHRYFKSSRVFTAIFPRISMFNHSCDPNIRNCFEGSTLTVYATRKISADEEILNCYGPTFKIMPERERKLHLRQQYCFECNCSRCSADDDSHSEFYNLIKCPLKDCGKVFCTEIEENNLQYLKCLHCGGEMDWKLYEMIQNIVEADRCSSNHLFRQCLKAYEEGSRMLTMYNQSKISILHLIFDQFLQYAGRDELCLSSLKRMATDFVKIRQHQFGYMSMEYIVGCFYLLDLLAIEYCSTGGTVMDDEQCKILQDFRVALSIVGENSRTTIVNYINKFVTIN